jgi:dipeptidyl aminopeptidase/acylaminoacyl peptidase
MMRTRTRPFGSWPSPITAKRISVGSLRLSQPRLDRGTPYWLEGRPAQGGRQVVVRLGAGGVPEDVTPDGVDVRTRVHEYGGGDYCVREGAVFYVRSDDGRVMRRSSGGATRALTDGSARHADLEVSPDGRWLVAVEERHGEGAEPSNRLVAIPLPTGGAPREVASGFDFVSFPRFSADGRQLAFTAWCHPDMPWDATGLYLVEWSAGGPGPARRVAGEGAESIFQPSFSPHGRLTFVSDRSGWWNLEQLRSGTRRALCPMSAEFGRPQWVFGLSTYAFVDEGDLLCVVGSRGRYRLARLEIGASAPVPLDLPFDAYDGVQVEAGRACLIAAGPDRAPRVGSLDLATGEFTAHRESLDLELNRALVSVPESIEYATADGESAHAFLYRPANPECRGATDERPPLLVKSHGGPTSAAMAALDLSIQFWTSRGFAVVDVNYRGSSGFGRAYRDRLRGEWGVLDVSDCVDAARDVVSRGAADALRLAIRGSSAGGYTTLCALAFHDLFRAGASYYGIGDLEALARDTHKFEARYLDRLVGPYPERRDLYVARSPLRFAERISCPVIFFQGLEDPVVPPNQAEAMVEALAARGIPHAYVPFAGERHGFRRAENIQKALEAELYFYSKVFGFPVESHPRGVDVVGIP